VEDHERYRFSVTCSTKDLAVVYCLRALCQFVHHGKDRYSQIGLGGTKEKDWLAADRKITLRFSDQKYRDAFLSEATRLLPKGSWSKEDESDNNPAQRQGGQQI
jgi:hypothetical protein